MVAKGSPKFNMIAKGSPKLSRRILATAGSSRKKTTSSPRVKQRADWNPSLEKSLVEILLEYKDTGYRGDNGWNSEGWNKMVQVFHHRNKYVSYTKAQIQEKECQLKRDYKMLKEARKQSGSTWNESRNMVEGSPAMWDNLQVTFPKIKKFRNNKATFPLFDALGELYDGHLAEGTYNITSLDDEPSRQIHDVEDDILGLDVEPSRQIHDVEDEDEETQALGTEYGEERGHDGESEAATAARSGHQRRLPEVPRNKEEKEPKRPRSSTANIQGMMEKYWEMRTKQAEDEAREREKALAREELAREREQALAREMEQEREKEVARAPNYSVQKCVSVLNTMTVTKAEKAKAYAVFKSNINREIFLSACSEDEEAALIGLRSEMA